MAILEIVGGFAIRQDALGKAQFLGTVGLEMDLPTASYIISFSGSTAYGATGPFYMRETSQDIRIEVIPYELILNGENVQSDVNSASNSFWYFDDGSSQLVSTFYFDNYTVFVPIGENPLVSVTDTASFSTLNNSITGSGRILGSISMTGDQIGDFDTSSDLTTEEISTLEALWDSVSGVNSAYKSMTSGLIEFMKKTDAEFDGTAIDALLENSVWEQVRLYPSDYDGTDMQELLRVAGQMETAQNFIDHVKNTELLGKVKVGTIAENLPDALEIIQTVWEGFKAINEMRKSGDTAAGYEPVESLLLGAVAGGVTQIITSSGVAVSIGGILSGAGYASIVTVAGVTFSIGLGVVAVSNEINKAYDVTGGISDLYRTALIEWHSDGGFGFGGDSAPRNLTGDYYVIGGDGADTLRGQENDDLIYGSGGDDTLIGGGGADEMHGGTGNDTYYVDHKDDKVFEIDLSFFSEDIDTVYSSVSFALGSNVDNLFLVGAEDLDGTGNVEDNNMRGNSGENRLDGGRGDDLINGYAGNDVLIDGKGSDKLYGGKGHDKFIVSNDNKADEFYGGMGNDTLSFAKLSVTGGQILDLRNSVANGAWGKITYSDIENVTGSGGADSFIGNSKNNILRGNAGADVLKGLGGKDDLSGGAGKDFLYGGNGEDLLQGGLSNDSLWGGSQNDDLYGGSGNDILEGQKGKDKLFGGEGKDTLKGGGGQDELVGGAGKDKMFGGVDSVEDVFIFMNISDSKKGLSNDHIYDFLTQIDVIDLSSIDADIYKPGNQTFSFTSQNNAIDNGVWLVKKFGGDYQVRGDVNGDGKYDFQIRLHDIEGSLSTSDFIL